MTKFWVLFSLMLLGLYFVILGNFAFALVTSAAIVGNVFGWALLVFPLVASWAVALEIKFGADTEKMAKQVQAEGIWPLLDFETHPSGRPVKASALQVFERIKRESDKHQDDWHSWFNLGLAYDACGDRKRARAALRKALKMKKTAG